MAKPAAQAALSQWTLLYVDADRLVPEQSQWNISAVPALRVLSMRGALVNSHDGYLDADALVEWLTDSLAEVNKAPDELLMGESEPSLPEVVRLVRLCEARDATLREAAIRRLVPYPQAAGKSVSKAFREGSLAARLAMYEVLQQWQAPLEGLDPWQEDTFTPERLAALDEWLKTTVAATEPRAESAYTEESRQTLLADIPRLLQANENEATAIIERLAHFGKAALPDVVTVLSEISSDQDRRRLLTLRYRLVAGNLLPLTWPGGLERLADSDPQVRHKAAEELAGAASEQDQDLLLELFSDPDPLVRELSLRGLRSVGGEKATAALVALLKDPEPNVRAAVLKQLSEDASEDLVKPITEYVTQETDPDLIVHAIRFLRQAKSKRAVPCLTALLEHESWQVRAEAAESMTAMIESMSNSFGSDDSADEIPDIYDALLKRLDDTDAFVVNRALTALTQVDTEEAVEPLVRTAVRHRDLAVQAIAILARGSQMRVKAIPHLREFLTSDDASLRASAVTGLTAFDTEDLGDILQTALKDQDSVVRVAAATAVMQVFEQARRPQESSVSWSATPDMSSFEVYESPSFGEAMLQGLRRMLIPGSTVTPPGSTIPPPTVTPGEPPVPDEPLSMPVAPDAEPSTEPSSAPETPPGEEPPNEKPTDEKPTDEQPTTAPPTTTGPPREVKPSPVDVPHTAPALPNVSPLISNELNDSESFEIETEEEGNEGENTDSAEDSDADSVADSDIWLNELYAGKHRKEWLGEMVESLRGMLQASDASERHAAAMAMLPYGLASEAQPVLIALMQQDPELLAKTTRGLAWVLWPDRKALFDEMLKIARNDTERAEVVTAFASVADPRASELLWSVLNQSDSTKELLSMVHYSLQQLYFGQSYYDRSRLTTGRRRRVQAALEPHIVQGPPPTRFLAISLLAPVAAERSLEELRRMINDTTIPANIRDDAFQLMLLISTPSERTKEAIAALSQGELARQRVALRFLALGTDALTQLTQSKIFISTGMFDESIGLSSRSVRTGEAIVPTAPRGVKSEHVRPLLTSSDAEIAALAGYLLTLLGEPDGLEPLITYWRAQPKNQELDRLVYRAVAVHDDPQYIPLLREIYGRIKQQWDQQEFYWTIRIMGGPEILEFRKRLRDEIGIGNLQ
jgi:HEAT repeat protein